MRSPVETLVPAGSPPLIGPYSHVARFGRFITIGGIGGVDPATGKLSGDDVRSQTIRILRSFEAIARQAGG